MPKPVSVFQQGLGDWYSYEGLKTSYWYPVSRMATGDLCRIVPMPLCNSPPTLNRADLGNQKDITEMKHGSGCQVIKDITASTFPSWAPHSGESCHVMKLLKQTYGDFHVPRT